MKLICDICVNMNLPRLGPLGYLRLRTIDYDRNSYPLGNFYSFSL